jgi:hypothetical protein
MGRVASLWRACAPRRKFVKHTVDAKSKFAAVLERLEVVVDDREEQVLGIDSGDFLLGDKPGPDQGHLRQGAGFGLLECFLDLLKPLRIKPVAPGQQLQNERLDSSVGE